MSFDMAIPKASPDGVVKIRLGCRDCREKGDRIELVFTKAIADALGVWDRGKVEVLIGMLGDENVVRLRPGERGYWVDRRGRATARALRMGAYHFRDRGYPMPRHEMTDCHGIKAVESSGTPCISFVLPRWCRRSPVGENASGIGSNG